jgi:hypothetical protein
VIGAYLSGLSRFGFFGLVRRVMSDDFDDV